jgi:hypothetical protein
LTKLLIIASLLFAVFFAEELAAVDTAATATSEVAFPEVANDAGGAVVPAI